LSGREGKVVDRRQQAKIARSEAKFRGQWTGNRRIDVPEQKRQVVDGYERQEYAQYEMPISLQAAGTLTSSRLARGTRS
jgi:hypothetical protein